MSCGTRPLPSSVAIGAVVAGLEGEISMTSHFVGFRVSPLFAAKVHRGLIYSCRVVRELLIVRISSAWMKPPAYVSPTNGPRPLLCMDFKIGSIISRKNTGEREDRALKNSTI